MGDVILPRTDLRWPRPAPRDRMKSAEAEATDANERLRSVLASVSDCYFTLDRAYRVTDLNEAAAAWVGPDLYRVIGACLWDLCSPGAECSCVIQEGMEGRCRIRREVMSGLRPDHWLDLLVCPSVEGLSVFFTDITERHAAQQPRPHWTNSPAAS
jgi:two-component system, NarL family, sensor kinase